MKSIEPNRAQVLACATWHMERAEKATHEGRQQEAARHDQIAFRLFKKARELST